MTLPEAQEIVKLLASFYQMRAPRVRLTGRTKSRRGVAYYGNLRGTRTGAIRLGNAADEWVVLHEFAHCRHGYWNGLLARREEPHGEAFFNTLWDIAESWYGDPRRYPWAKEYKQVKRWAEGRIARRFTPTDAGVGST